MRMRKKKNARTTCRALRKAGKQPRMSHARKTLHNTFEEDLTDKVWIATEYEWNGSNVERFVVRLMFEDEKGNIHSPSRFDNTHDELREPHMDVLEEKDSNHAKVWHRSWSANESINNARDYYKVNFEWIIEGYRNGWKPTFEALARVHEKRPWE